MKKLQNLDIRQKENILILTINRPEKRNALDLATLKEIKQVMQDVYANPTVRGIIITGAGDKAFIAGADISEFMEMNEVNSRKFAENGQEIFALLENSPKPVIAAVNGFALGGGCELAMACHLRIAVETAKFGQPEVNLGIIPGYGGTQRMTQLVGKSKAMEWMMTGDMILAQEAHQYGLVNHLVATQEELLPKAEELLTKILSKAPVAIEMVIECVNAVFNKDENGYQTEANAFSICCKTEDFKEGTRAFLEKRPANFQGR
ncbi:enoyl-CoA hydratase-related protein [Cytophagaceae bacterium DM2B3-1]|uniref:Enoyl-CoA hydratase-related protein n=1 Tax=Xanthocytophaga flava TaxID=3048013 RepID=A0ABT7CK83_9BACT|nr:enoyl-CoA hydratase-related protein [Xanthocytophaga flavus]MDJ1468537.1 enoyl-CoA hydratase-related protein [Xanthocytophaga flavus]MDJ1493432.1 enoyl-CoA hydratase-related protein [Xanthocytophaga flavus]